MNRFALVALVSLGALAPLASAQFAVPSDAVAAFVAAPPADFAVSSAESTATLPLLSERLNATYAVAAGPALDVIAQQPLVFAPGVANARARGYVARLALDQELSSGAFRPFVGVALGRIYGETSRENWSAGVAGGARYFVQPDTYVHASLDYGWMFSPARSFNDRLADGQWTWSMGVGFRF